VSEDNIGLEKVSLIRRPFDGCVNRLDGTWNFQHCHLPIEKHRSDKDYTANGYFITKKEVEIILIALEESNQILSALYEENHIGDDFMIDTDEAIGIITRQRK